MVRSRTSSERQPCAAPCPPAPHETAAPTRAASPSSPPSGIPARTLPTWSPRCRPARFARRRRPTAQSRPASRARTICPKQTECAERSPQLAAIPAARARRRGVRPKATPPARARRRGVRPKATPPARARRRGIRPKATPPAEDAPKGICPERAEATAPKAGRATLGGSGASRRRRPPREHLSGTRRGRRFIEPARRAGAAARPVPAGPPLP